ncbi:hypothetical protein [Bradyrhizobium sp. BR 10261]|uniref:hypothetical protein n=1 Tax=Bradyrhizobium sp. BR 10261 TaxID=2749992 RepID=UPI001C6466AA|nr:hypothetical protein [Bradyrhizobium sp. BR 10261]MBW7964144.1 hypothetical protein [Bradyrhizobium sp. BR 10261]
MSTSDLQEQFLSFAKGMPALAFAKSLLTRQLSEMKDQLGGAYPEAGPAMGNIPLPVFDLAYSAFLDDIHVSVNGDTATLQMEMRATVHRISRPSEIIREYRISLKSEPAIIKFQYLSTTRTLAWAEDGNVLPKITPSWGANADDVLVKTSIPDPKEDCFLREVEQPILWNTSNAFVSLVVNALPCYDLASLAPWLTLLDPIRITASDRYILVSASRAKVDIGGCTPMTMVVEPDPDFPYGESLKPADCQSTADVAVYLPKTRIGRFVAGSVEPAILINSGEKGGAIRWQIMGSFGIKAFIATVSGGIAIGDPATGLVVSGLLELRSLVDFLGVARAWVDAPSGKKLSLASTSVIGNGGLGVDVTVRLNPTTGVLNAELVVTQAIIHPDFVVDTPLGWALNAIAGTALDDFAKLQVSVLRGTVARGQWEIMSVPPWCSHLLSTGAQAVPVLEGREGVAAIFGVGVRPS